MTDLATQLRNARGRYGHSQEEAASAMGVHTQTVVSIESGRTKRPYAPTEAKLTEYMKSAPGIPATTNATDVAAA